MGIKKTRISKNLYRTFIKREKKNKSTGITLIALVITIVILIILAGVLINLAIGNNGLLERSRQASNQYNQTTALEEMQIKVTNIYMYYYSEGKEDVTLQDLVDKLYDDETVEYIKLGRELADKTRVIVNGFSSIIVKLKSYNFEFEITDNAKVSIYHGDDQTATSGKEFQMEDISVKISGSQMTIVPNKDNNIDHYEYSVKLSNNELNSNLHSNTIQIQGYGIYDFDIKAYNSGNELIKETNFEINLISENAMGFQNVGEQKIKLKSGRYILECWGAQGGDASTYTGGYGGYSVGTLTLNNTTELYINVGGRGQKGVAADTTYEGGYNGGGNSDPVNWCDCYNGSGGGATHIATKSGVLSSLSSEADRDTILIVAGGRRRCR